MRRLLNAFFLAVIVAALVFSSGFAFQGEDPQPGITAYDLISLVNQIRTANGLGALVVNDILMATAQGTAETMAANHMSGHIGDVSGRVMAAGYGGGVASWATENFAVGDQTLSSIQSVWADDLHMIPMNNPNYCHIGAGVAQVDGITYYVVQAAYSSNNAGCSNSGSTGTGTSNVVGSTQIPFTEPTSAVSQLIIPVQTVTPQADGFIAHEVKAGQTLWAIATAYGVHIEDLMAWNYYISPENQEIYVGQKVYIMSTVGPLPSVTPTYAVTPTIAVLKLKTPVPVAMIKTSTLTASPVANMSVVPVKSEDKDAESQNFPILYGVLGLFCLGAVLVIFGSTAGKK